MARKHAVLSASSAARWIACPPSARLNAEKSDTPSEYAAQGTDAHTLCEYKLRKALGGKARDPTKHLASYDTEMEECAEAYCQFVMELVGQFRAESKDTMVSVEQRVDFSAFVPDGFGTADTLIISGKTVCIVDYKHGKGIEVSADHNPQMMCYALGCIQMCIPKYNHEGYADPTAHTALTKVFRRNQFVYICSPYRDSPRVNVMRARQYCKFAVSKGRIPLAPHLYFPQFLSEIDERGKAMSMNLELLRLCGEVWVFGERVTDGMEAEIAHAGRLRKNIRYFTTKCEEKSVCK